MAAAALRRHVPETTIPLSDDESAAALARYAEAHPRVWRNLRSTIESAAGRPVHRPPMIALQLRWLSGSGYRFERMAGCFAVTGSPSSARYASDSMGTSATRPSASECTPHP